MTHVERIAGNRWPKQMLKRMPPMRKRRRLRSRRMNGIEDAKAERGVDEGHG